MIDQNADRNHGPYQVRGTSSEHSGWLRTRIAIERTLLAWIRTGVSLIGFGFAIVQFFSRMENLSGAAPARFPDAARYFGLMLIGCGVLSLVVSIWQYLASVNYMWSESFAAIGGVENERRKTPLLAVSIALILVGLAAFLSIFLRLL